MSRLPLLTITLALTLTGISIFLYKALYLHFPLVPGTKAAVWNVEARLSFRAENGPVKASIFIPKNTSRYIVMDENFISRGFALATGLKENNRQALWSIRKASGQQNLYYHAVVRELERRENVNYKPPPLVEHGFEGSTLEAAQALLGEAHGRASDTESLVRELMLTLNRSSQGDNASLLLGRKPTEVKKADIVVRILALSGTAARVVHGVSLRDTGRKTRMRHWIEVFQDRTWHAYDPVSSETEVPRDYLQWWVGTEAFVSLEGGGAYDTDVSIEAREEEAVDAVVEGVRQIKPALLDYSLFSLPIQNQVVFKVLLLVPIGAFFVVILRNIVGLSTFGTFMPILLALAFRETELFWGVVLCSIMVALGLLVRLYLEHLKLLLVPRLAAMLTIVILLMAAISVITSRMGLELGLSVALFPMVIMTMIIERMSVVWDESGALAALQQAGSTLLVAALVYLGLHIKHLEHLVFVFPELLLVVLALTILLGRYTGYRWLELLRFRELTR